MRIRVLAGAFGLFLLAIGAASVYLGAEREQKIGSEETFGAGDVYAGILMMAMGASAGMWSMRSDA